MSALDETEPKDDSAAQKGTWKKCLSRRLNKFYYFNAVTKESKWFIDDVIEPLKLVESKDSISSGSGHHPNRPNHHELQNGHMFPEPDGPPTDEMHLLDLPTGKTEIDTNVKLKLFSDLLREPIVNQMFESHILKLLSKHQTEAGTSASKNSLVSSTENINTTQSTDMEYRLRSIDLDNSSLDPRTSSHATDLPLNERFKQTSCKPIPERRRSTSDVRVSSSNGFLLERNNFQSSKLHSVEVTADSCTDNDSSQIELNELIDKCNSSAEISPERDVYPEEDMNMEQETSGKAVAKLKVTKKVKLSRNLPPNDLRLTLRKRRRRMSVMQDPDGNKVCDHSENAGTLLLFDETKLDEHMKQFKEKCIKDISMSDDSMEGGDGISITSSKKVTFAPNTKVMDDSSNSNTMEDDSNSECEISAENINLERLAHLYHHVYGEGDWYLIVDTNILLSNLSFVQTLCDVSRDSDIAPMVLIPWKVLSELDDIKDSNKKLYTRLRKAKTFLNDHLHTQERRSKVFGQSVLEDSTKMFRCRSPDDEILNCCMQKVHEGYHVGLLSNDVNLCNKAIVNNITAYSVKNLKTLLQQDKMVENSEYNDNIRNTNARFDQKELSSIKIYVENKKKEMRSEHSNVETENKEKQSKSLRLNSEKNVTGSNAVESFSALIRSMTNTEPTSNTPKHVMAISSSLGSLNLDRSPKSKETNISSTTENIQRPRKREPIVFDANNLKQKQHVLKKSKPENNTDVTKSATNDKLQPNDVSDNIFRRFILENPINNKSDTVLSDENNDVTKKTFPNPFSSDKSMHIFRQVNVASGQIITLKSPEKLSNVNNLNPNKNITKTVENNLDSEISQKEMTQRKQWYRRSTSVILPTQNNPIRKKKVLLKRKKVNDSDSITNESNSQASSNLGPSVEKNTQPPNENLMTTNIDSPSTNICAEMISKERLNDLKTSFPSMFSEKNWNIFEAKMSAPLIQSSNENIIMSKVRKTDFNQNVNTLTVDCRKACDTNEISSTQNEMMPLEKDIISGQTVLTRLNTSNNNPNKTFELLQKVSDRLNYGENTNLKAATNVGLSKRINLIRDAVNEQRTENLAEGGRCSVSESKLWIELSINKEKGEILIEEQWEGWCCAIRQMLENVLSTFLEKLLTTGGDVCKWILPSPWSLHDALGCLVKVMPPGSELGIRELRQKIVDLATKLSLIINQFRCAGDLKLPKPSSEVFLEFYNLSRLLILSFSQLNIENWISEELQQAKTYFENILNNLQYYIFENFVESEHMDIDSGSLTPKGDTEEPSSSPVRGVTSPRGDSVKKVFEYLNKYYPSFSRNIRENEKINSQKISENEIKSNNNEKSAFDNIIDEITTSANIKKNTKFDDVQKSSNFFNGNSKSNTQVNNVSKSLPRSPKNSIQNTKLNDSHENIEFNVSKTKSPKNVMKMPSKKFDFSNIKISRTITNDRVNLSPNEKKSEVETISNSIAAEKSKVATPTIVRKLDFSIPQCKPVSETPNRKENIVEKKEEHNQKNKKRSNSEDSGIVNENCNSTFGEMDEKKCEQNMNVVLALKAIQKTIRLNMEKWMNMSNTNNFTREQSAEPIVSDNLKILIRGMKSFLTLDSDSDLGLDHAVGAINNICESDLNGRKITKEAMKRALEQCDSFLVELQKFEEVSEVMIQLME